MLSGRNRQPSSGEFVAGVTRRGGSVPRSGVTWTYPASWPMYGSKRLQSSFVWAAVRSVNI